MSQPVPVPGEQERKAFAERLGQFRSTLAESEQRMLDAMVIAAFAPERSGEVQGYGGYQWFYGTPEQPYPSPGWYQPSGAAAWNGTPWETIYIGLPLSPPGGHS